MSAQSTAVAPAPRAAGELVSIQYLRGVAAMLVVIFHLQPQFVRMGYHGAWLPGLSGGVDIFFVISGFIMWVTTCGKPITPWTFWRRRITRIVPLYWLITSFMVVLMVVAPRVLQTSRFDAAHVVASYLFLAWPHPAKVALEPVVMPGWTLNYEMFFYLIFGLSLLVPSRWRMIGTVGGLVALVGIGCAGSFGPLTIAGFYTSDLMLEFAFGMGLGWIATRNDLYGRAPKAAGWTAVILGLTVILAPIWPDGLPRVVTRGIASAIVVAGALVIEAHGLRYRVPLLKHLGDASYSIYLSHVVTMSAVSQAWRLLRLDHLPVALFLFSLVCITACGIVGWLCYRYVEQPMIHLFRARGTSGMAIKEIRA